MPNGESRKKMNAQRLIIDVSLVDSAEAQQAWNVFCETVNSLAKQIPHSIIAGMIRGPKDSLAVDAATLDSLAIIAASNALGRVQKSLEDILNTTTEDNIRIDVAKAMGKVDAVFDNLERAVKP
jgi:protein required for attachment to host cells